MFYVVWNLNIWNATQGKPLQLGSYKFFCIVPMGPGHTNIISQILLLYLPLRGPPPNFKGHFKFNDIA